ncbi:MAG: hypothetical protein OQL20_04615 [Sedimenticola sp.]|nr:hypothetical protein [Sedimenticola sp.]
MSHQQDQSEDGYILIDPPVSAYSSEKEILDWIVELKKLPNRVEVEEALEDAKRMLRASREHNQ